jgi:hypothetical protein
MLTLENISEAIKCAETYLEREAMTPDNPAAVLKDDTSDSKEILAIKAELVELKAAHATVITTTQGHGDGRRIQNKCRRGCSGGGARTAKKEAVDACKRCGNRHPGRPCWKEGDKKREQGLAHLQETESILARRSITKSSSLEIKS